MKRILLLYGFHESGHLSICKALKEEIESYNYEVVLLTIWNQKFITVNKLFSIFRKCVQYRLDYFPHFLLDDDLLHTFSQDIQININLSDFDLIISTHPYTSFVVAECIKQNNFLTPLIDFHTDFTPFPVVEHEKISYHIGMFPKMVNKLSTVSKSIISFLPVSQRFYDLDTSEKENKIVIMGGADGFGHIEDSLNWALDVFTNHEIVVLCGRNQELFEILTHRFTNNNIHILGYSENVEKYLHKAKFIISKASGSTIAEALVMNAIPIFAPSDLPWERDAAMQLNHLHIGISIRCFSKEEGEYVSNIIRTPFLINRFLSAQQGIVKKNIFAEISTSISQKKEMNIDQYTYLKNDLSNNFPNIDCPNVNEIIDSKMKEWIFYE
jgi:processive 1,2-diacylglycerol beta-glucosyltransferase